MNATAAKIVVTAANFMRDVVEASAERPVLIDFWAPWCAPCRSLMPVLDRLADDYAGRFILAKVNTDEEQQLANHFQIRSIPTVMLVHRGEVVEQFMGGQPETAIRALLDKHVAPAGNPEAEAAAAAASTATAGPPTDTPEVRALRHLELRDAAGASASIEEIASTRPDHPALPALRARLAFVEIANANADVVALRETLQSHPEDPAARHVLAAHHAVLGDFGTALAEWLEVLRRNRHWGDGAAQRSLRQAFDVLGEEDPLVAQYRRRMASLLH